MILIRTCTFSDVVCNSDNLFFVAFKKLAKKGQKFLLKSFNWQVASNSYACTYVHAWLFSMVAERL